MVCKVFMIRLYSVVLWWLLYTLCGDYLFHYGI